MMLGIKNKIPLYLAVFIVLALFFSSINNAFFWDTVQLGSLHANFYYSTNFSTFLLPNSLDSGHIPFFGMYLAFVWKIFAKNLQVSHLAMLPFVLGILVQSYKLIRTFINKKHVGFAFLLLLLDPTLLAQISLISPDVFLVFFMLLSLNAILKNNKLILTIGIFFLFLTSMRGMMVAFILLLIDCYYTINYRQKIKFIVRDLLKRSLLYFPALLLFIAFVWYHYETKGWIGYHEDSPWAESFQAVDFKGFLYNIGIFCWRLIDFGRIAVWLVFAVLVLRNKTLILDKKNRFLLVVSFLFIALLPLNMLWAKGLLAHRYLLPIYIVFSLFTAKLLFSLKNKKLQKGLQYFWLIIIISGSFWIYPDKIAQGWDATPAHLPYYQLRKDALHYLDDKYISLADVKTFFPNDGFLSTIDLTKDTRSMARYDAATNNEYVFYSNCFNIDDMTYDTLTKDYIILREFKNNGVFVRILKQKKASN